MTTPAREALYLAQYLVEMEGRRIADRRRFASRGRLPLGQFTRPAVSGGRGMTPVHQIQATVADYYGIELAELRSRDRHERVAWPRQVAMHLSVKINSMPPYRVGILFDRDNGTVRHAIKHVKGTMDVDPVRRAQVEELEARFNKYSGDSITSTGIPQTRNGDLAQ